MEKILSIVIPSYNVEKTLGETVQTLINNEIIQDIEVLIVDDGSKDQTSTIGLEFQEKYPESIRLISKVNGGHGSTINTGIKHATGKYFKVIDGDDWVEQDNFVKLVKKLKNIEADIVVNSFYTVNDVTREKEICKNSDIVYEKMYSFKELPNHIRIEMHAMTIKTSILKDNNVVIDEHRFYVDAEYILFPIPFVETVVFYDYPVYMYRVANINQSMSVKNMQKNIQHHYDVLFHIIEFYNEIEQKGVAREKLDYIFRRILKLIEMQHQIYLSFSYDKKVKSELMEFDRKLKLMNTELYRCSGEKTVSILRKTRFTLYPLAVLRQKLRKN